MKHWEGGLGKPKNTCSILWNSNPETFSKTVDKAHVSIGRIHPSGQQCAGPL